MTNGEQRINIVGVVLLLLGFLRQILQNRLTEKLLVHSDRAFVTLGETLQRGRRAVKELTVRAHNGYSLLML